MKFYFYRFKTEDEAVKIANSVDVGLAGIEIFSLKISLNCFLNIFSLFL
jgi:hypothetical protein